MYSIPIQLTSPVKEISCLVGQNLWAALREFLEKRFPTHGIYAISDSKVADLYGEMLRTQLSAHPGFREILTFPAGEASKSRQQKDRLEDQLLAKKAGRDSLIIAMGGGVTGDLAGYLAATLHRGIPLIHLPTSLLAQVDSSIGGKVGINHPAGKNLIGAFYQPEAIYCDVQFLQSLSEEEFCNGMAEVIKYAIILDRELWDWLETEATQIRRRELPFLIKIISRCARLKIAVVEADEKEGGYRSVLNFGHSVGHAIEQLSNYQIKHGFAVAAGMRIAARLSHRHCGFPRQGVERLDRLLAAYDLDGVALDQFSFDAIWERLGSDKKARQQKPRFTLLNAANEPELFYPIAKEELKHVLRLA